VGIKNDISKNKIKPVGKSIKLESKEKPKNVLADLLGPPGSTGDGAGVQPTLFGQKKPADPASPTKKRTSPAKKGPTANKPGGVTFFHR
jgi:hypothetical protein